MEEEKGAETDSGLCRGPARAGKASFPRDLGPPRHSSASPLVPWASHSFCQVSSYPLKLPDPVSRLALVTSCPGEVSFPRVLS